MVSKKALSIDGTIITMVIVVVLVPSVLLTPQTAEFRAAFMKKCEEFPESKQTCEKGLATFEQAYVGKNKKDVVEKNYEHFFDQSPFKYPCGKTMFWSGIDRVKTKDLVHRFTAKRDHFFTLEDSLWGHVLDGLQWCGEEGSKETFTEHCSDSKPNPVISFWRMASAKIGQHACDDVTVMLDGERDQPYYSGSVFATVEVPNLKSSQVRKVIVVLVVQEKGEKCNKDSLKDLSNILRGKEIDYFCKEVTQSHIEKCIKEKKASPACW